jgi:hypothetical protein
LKSLELKGRGLLIALTISLRKDDSALATWKNHLKSVGAPYLVIQNGKGCVILKECKDFHCKNCGHFLNIKPKKYRVQLTHKTVGGEFVKR